MEQILLGVQLSSEPYHPGHPQKLLGLLCADSDAISLDTVSKLLAQGVGSHDILLQHSWTDAEIGDVTDQAVFPCSSLDWQSNVLTSV